MEKFTLNDRDIDVLRSFLIFPWLTPKQVCRLYWSDNSLKYVEKRLVWLTEERYIKRYKEPHPIYPYFYGLADRGARLIEDKPLFYPSQRIHFMHLPHFLMTNEVLIAALRLQSPTPYYLYHDFTLKHMLKVAVPDAFVELRMTQDGTQAERIPICFEVHLKTGERKFKAKIKAILECVRGEYREVFKTSAVTWAFVTPYENKLEEIIRWAQEELEELHETREADLFRFAVVPEKQIDPVELFTKQIFRIPFSQKGFVDALLPII